MCQVGQCRAAECESVTSLVDIRSDFSCFVFRRFFQKQTLEQTNSVVLKRVYTLSGGDVVIYTTGHPGVDRADAEPEATTSPGDHQDENR